MSGDRPTKTPDAPDPSLGARIVSSETAADVFAEAAGLAPHHPDDTRPRVLLFFDYACPFCYVDRLRFLRLERETHAEVLPIPFELRPDLPEEGMSAAAYGFTHATHVEEFLVRQADAEGCGMTLPDLVPNTHRAIVAGEVARDAGAETHRRVHAALFDAYFGRGEDIGRPEVVLAAVEAAGLSGAAVEKAWREGTHEKRLRDFKDLGHVLGITGTPAAVICDELLVGTRPYRQLVESVGRCMLTPDDATRP